jgi:putative transposase
MPYKGYRTKLKLNNRQSTSSKTRQSIPILRKKDNTTASSQLCSDCGHQQKMPLQERTMKCEECGMVKDRDFNASLNLEHYPTAVGLTVDACGASAADSPC